MGRFAHCQALRGGLRSHPASKRIVPANNRSIPAKRRIENLDNLAERMGCGERQAGRTDRALLRRSRFDIDPGSAVFVRRALGPATKGMPEGGGVTEPQCVCDVFDRQVGIADVFDRRVRP